MPKKHVKKLSEIPQIEVDIKSNLDDWHKVEAELLSKNSEYF